MEVMHLHWYNDDLCKKSLSHWDNEWNDIIDDEDLIEKETAKKKNIFPVKHAWLDKESLSPVLMEITLKRLPIVMKK